MAGGETYIQEYYILEGIDDSKGEFRPIYDESSKFYQDTYSTGAVPDKEEL